MGNCNTVCDKRDGTFCQLLWFEGGITISSFASQAFRLWCPRWALFAAADQRPLSGDERYTNPRRKGSYLCFSISTPTFPQLPRPQSWVPDCGCRLNSACLFNAVCFKMTCWCVMSLTSFLTRWRWETVEFGCKGCINNNRWLVSVQRHSVTWAGCCHGHKPT